MARAVGGGAERPGVQWRALQCAAGTMLTAKDTSAALRSLALRWISLMASGQADRIASANTTHGPHDRCVDVLLAVVQAEAKQGKKGLVFGLYAQLPASHVIQSSGTPYFIQDGGLAVLSKIDDVQQTAAQLSTADAITASVRGAAEPMAWLAAVSFTFIAQHGTRIDAQDTDADVVSNIFDAVRFCSY